MGSIGVTASLPFAEEAVLMLAVDMVDVVVFVLSSVLACNWDGLSGRGGCLPSIAAAIGVESGSGS